MLRDVIDRANTAPYSEMNQAAKTIVYLVRGRL